MDRNTEIFEFITERNWLSVDGPEAISFLAAGEYNENHRISGKDGQQYVFRINHDTQLGLEDQIGYEFSVLEAVAASGVTPRPLHVDARGSDAFPRGALLMEYCPGGSFSYERDWRDAAAAFAAIHTVDISDSLIVQADPVRDIVQECDGLLSRYSDHPLTSKYNILARYRDEVAAMADDLVAIIAADELCIVNTEVNSGNFIVDREGEKKLYLVDWEKAVVSSRFQDLGHFLVPTTTLWKSDFRFDEQGKRHFVAEYLLQAGIKMPFEDAMRGVDVLEQTILLRAMSWCYMAWYEYTRPGRMLRDEFTFSRIERYLDEMECFFKHKA